MVVLRTTLLLVESVSVVLGRTKAAGNELTGSLAQRIFIVGALPELEPSRFPFFGTVSIHDNSIPKAQYSYCR